MVQSAREVEVNTCSLWEHAYREEQAEQQQQLDTLAGAKINGLYVYQLRGIQEGGLWTLYRQERHQNYIVLIKYIGRFTTEAAKQFTAGWYLTYSD